MWRNQEASIEQTSAFLSDSLCLSETQRQASDLINVSERFLEEADTVALSLANF